MKEKIYTIPLNDAVNAGDECPLCFMERKIEQDALDLTLGGASSYMKPDTREMTDKEGFCRRHFKMMFDYGNALGCAWILSTHMRRVSSGLEEAMKCHTTVSPQKGHLSFLKGRTSASGSSSAGSGRTRTDSVAQFACAQESSCFICNRIEDTKKRYIETFFYLWQKDDSFREKILSGRGFCIPHFGDLCEAAHNCLPEKEQQAFFDAVFKLMQDNLSRVTGDVDWMIEKFDYKHADDPWKNSKDAVQRAMQKLKGGYPADKAHQMKK